MLLDISIKNVAIIEEVSLHFNAGMTILSGETGAGKSIIIDAMNLLLGSRATTDIIRHGQKKAEIEGFFTVERNREALREILDYNGIDWEDELVLRRDIFDNGRSVSRINGKMVTVSVLKEVGQHLVSIHGQHDQEELMKVSQHIQLLDHFGDKAFQTVKQNYQRTFLDYRNLRHQIEKQQKNERDNKARIEMIAFQIAEIESVGLRKDEDKELNDKRDKLVNHKDIADTLVSVSTSFDNDDFSTLTNLRNAMNDMQSISDYDSDYQKIANLLTDHYYALDDVYKQIQIAIDSLDFDGQELMQVEQRLNQINTITQKYGPSVSDVLDYLAQIKAEYDLLTGGLTSDENGPLKLKALEQDLLELAAKLSQKRHALAKQLEITIHQELKDLYMEQAQFKVQFTKAKFSPLGNEQVEFYISTNLGEDFKPLVKVASGGERSRLMLAIKSVLSAKEDKTSIIFDEVDTGVSGRVAQAIAQKMYKIGQHSQVLAISHLPQVIAIADDQYFIEKKSENQATVSTARLLTTAERVEEIAKMLAGDKVTQAARKQAQALVNKKA